MVVLTQLFRHGNAVHVSHFNIQKKDVIFFILSVMKKKILRRSKFANTHRRFLCTAPLFHKGGKEGAICRFIITNCNSINGVHFLPPNHGNDLAREYFP